MKSRELERCREARQLFHPIGGDEIIFLDANARAEGFVVKPWLGGEDFAFLKCVVPIRIQVRRFMREEPDTVAEVVVE